jgi:hypothetical protein
MIFLLGVTLTTLAHYLRRHVRAALPCDANGDPAAYILKLRKAPGPATT